MLAWAHDLLVGELSRQELGSDLTLLPLGCFYRPPLQGESHQKILNPLTQYISLGILIIRCPAPCPIWFQ